MATRLLDVPFWRRTTWLAVVESAPPAYKLQVMKPLPGSRMGPRSRGRWWGAPESHCNLRTLSLRWGITQYNEVPAEYASFFA